MSRTLTRPTVGDVISALRQLPPGAQFEIQDPDTSWWIHTFELNYEDGLVWIDADYADMESRR